MRTVRYSRIYLAAFAVLAAVAEPADAAGKPRSSATPHTATPVYTVTTSPDDIVVRKPDGRIAFSAKAFAAAELTALKRLEGADLQTVQHRYSIVSLAGSLLAIRDEVDLNARAPLPAGYTRYWAIDLRQPPIYEFDDAEPLRPRAGGKVLLNLRQFYSQTVLAAAIGTDPLASRRPDSPVVRRLDDVLYDLAQRGTDPGRCYSADPDVTSSFAVVGKAKGRIIVRLGLSGQPACRYALQTIEIVLPASGTLATITAGRMTMGGHETAIVAYPDRPR